MNFCQWWRMEGAWVEAPNIRRAGESGVQYITDNEQGPLYLKRQIGHLYRSLRYPMGRPTVHREILAYRAFAKLGVRVPDLVFGEVQKKQGEWQALLITRELEGFTSLDRWYEEQNPSISLRRSAMEQIAQMMSKLHRNHWQHGCCYPKHVFIRASAEQQVEVALIDMEKSRRKLHLSSKPHKDLYQLFTHRGNIPKSDFRWLHPQLDNVE